MILFSCRAPIPSVICTERMGGILGFVRLNKSNYLLMANGANYATTAAAATTKRRNAMQCKYM